MIEEREIGYSAQHLDATSTPRQRMHIHKTTIKRLTLAGICYICAMTLFLLIL